MQKSGMDTTNVRRKSVQTGANWRKVVQLGPEKQQLDEAVKIPRAIQGD
jgi:hypothetical protein